MLETLRRKPDHIKRRVSFSLTVVIFSCIIFVWISSWDARMRNEEIRNRTVSPMVGVSSMFDNFVTGFKEKISGSPSFVDLGGTASSSVSATTTSRGFNMAEVVIIDNVATSTTP